MVLSVFGGIPYQLDMMGNDMKKEKLTS